MAIYQFADFIVDLQNQYPHLNQQCRDYRYYGDAPVDFTVCVTEEEREQERRISEQNLSEGYLESVCAYRKLCLQLPQREAFLLHASTITCRGRGIGFFAHSGVGKTTHTRLWMELYGKEIKIINGDKPIVRFVDGIPYAYGTPWAGKEGYQCNQRTELTDLCQIVRSKENKVERMSATEALEPLMHQVLRPAPVEDVIRTLDMVDRLLQHCRFWRISCTPEVEAAKLAYETILGGNRG